MRTDPTLHPDYDMLLDYILNDYEDKIKSYLEENPNLPYTVAVSLNYDSIQNSLANDVSNKSQQLIATFINSHTLKQHLCPDVLELLYDAVINGKTSVASQLLKCVNSSEICEDLYLELIAEATDNGHSDVVPAILENIPENLRFTKLYVNAIHRLIHLQNPADRTTEALFYKYIRHVTFIENDLANLGVACATNLTPKLIKALLSIHCNSMSDEDIELIFDRTMINYKYGSPQNARAVVPYLRSYPKEYDPNVILDIFPTPLLDLQKLEDGANEFMVTILVRTHISQTNIPLSEALATSPEWLHPYYIELLK